MQKGGEHGAADDQSQARQVDLRIAVGLDAEAELGDQPGGNEQQGEGLLKLIAQQQPAGARAQGPKHDGGGPVLLHVKDLADEGDGGPGGDRAERVHGDSEAREALVYSEAEAVKEGQHQQHQPQPRQG